MGARAIASDSAPAPRRRLAGAKADPRLADTRAKILDVAEALFARSGFSGVGLREVARAAGLSKSALFHHFEGKQQLYVDVLARVVARIDERVRPALGAAVGTGARLDALVDSVVDALAEHPTSARLLLRALFEDDQFPMEGTPEIEALDAQLASLVALFHGLVRDGVAEGVFRPVSVADATQTFIGATVYHFASGDFGEQLLGGAIFSAEAVARRKREVKHFLQAGLAAQAPTRSR